MHRGRDTCLKALRVLGGGCSAGREPSFAAAVELYYLADDLGETSRLAAQHPERVEEMQRVVRPWQQPNLNHFFVGVRAWE